MSEDQIERRVERMIDRLDEKYMNEEIDSEQYRIFLFNIKEWAEEQYALINIK